MKLIINYKTFNKNSFFYNYIIFADTQFKIKPFENHKISKKIDTLNRIIENFKDNKSNFININLESGERAIIVKLDENLTELGFEKLGAEFVNYLKNNAIRNVSFIKQNIVKILIKKKQFLDFFIMGAKLKSYNFSKYKTSKKNHDISFNIDKSLLSQNKNNKFDSLVNGINLTKDLVSEPGNILFPDEYAKRITKLRKFGLKIKIYNQQNLEKLGMRALLGVGQGSSKKSNLVTIEWNGSNKKNKPLAFVGKGVCFDTGGISLKPAKFMEDMTYDMAGSAVVVGLMKTLALRKAKVNAVGVVGLVENMPDGNAQRPGDIVKSYSGKTIEILNTDAEGRLVLADALTYTEKKYKPKFIIDLATLTGAIIVSLGSEYAGLFSNDDKISNQLFKAGEKVGEKVWRMPLNKNYDKLINSKKADMQNINYVGGAGSITAAQFLQRFILNKTPWAHLDIAGMAFSKYGGALNSDGATGYGVRLLNQLIEDNYE